MQCSYAGIALTGTPWQEGAGKVEWSADQQVSIVPIIGADAPTIVGKQNLIDKIRFTIDLAFNSYTDALSHCASFIWTLPTSGSLVLTTDSLTITYTLAAFEGINRSTMGEGLVTYDYNFSVQGPPIIT